MPINSIPLTPFFIVDLDKMILDYLPFSDLNRYVESWDNATSHDAEAILKKRDPSYVNVVKLLKDKNWEGLIQHLIENVLKRIKVSYSIPADNCEQSYLLLCQRATSTLQAIIRHDLYLSPVKTDLDMVFIRDCIFYFTQANPNAAGVLLNQYIWRFWHGYVSELLVAYGANVEMKHGDQSYCTLLKGLRFSASSFLIEMLLEKKANYDSYQESRHGLAYTMMLIAALEAKPSHLRALIRAYPDKVEPTLATLNEMLNKDSDSFYSCTFGNEKFLFSNKEEKLFYTLNDISCAQKKLYECMSQLNFVLKSPLKIMEVDSTPLISPTHRGLLRLS